MNRYVMIGAPITSVRTPPLLEAYFAERGVEAMVEARQVEPNDLDAFMCGFRDNADLNGLLVTMPHKKAILKYLDRYADTAIAAGSVNAVKRTPTGQLAGNQFDGSGLMNALLEKSVSVRSSRILLAGIGGAGMAIAGAIRAHGCGHLALADVNRKAVARAIHDLRQHEKSPGSMSEYKNETGFELLINATPLGMRPDDASPFDREMVSQAKWVADIVADPPQTRLAALAGDSGKVLISGRDMVNGQIAPIGSWLLDQD